LETSKRTRNLDEDLTTSWTRTSWTRRNTDDLDEYDD